MDIVQYNRKAWDSEVERGNRWTVPVSPEVFAAARRGQWEILLTPTRPVPAAWFPPLEKARVLCLAGSGGQQAPILTAAGATVTVLDNSPKQLAQDRLVAERENITINTIEGDMADLGMLEDSAFDLIVHPCSNGFVPDVIPVWREAFRVLRPGGVLLSGFLNPCTYIFADPFNKDGDLSVRFRLPYSDSENLPTAELDRLIEGQEPLVFSHTLTTLIGGQTEAGLVITDLYEDECPKMRLSNFMSPCIATRAKKRC